jgi:prephenate dehydrogenase
MKIRIIVKNKMKIYIIGIGLIGGSMALDIKGLYPEATVYGVDTDEDHLQGALALGVVDAGAQIENLSDADFVILSVPVDVALICCQSFRCDW